MKKILNKVLYNEFYGEDALEQKTCFLDKLSMFHFVQVEEHKYQKVNNYNPVEM